MCISEGAFCEQITETDAGGCGRLRIHDIIRQLIFAARGWDNARLLLWRFQYIRV